MSFKYVINVRQKCRKSIFSSPEKLGVGRLTVTNRRAVNLPYVKYWIIKNINTIIIIITVFNLRRLKRTKGNWEGVEKTAGPFFPKIVLKFLRILGKICSQEP